MRRLFDILLSITLVALVSCSRTSSQAIEHGNVSFDVSPNGESIIFADTNGELWQFVLSTGELTGSTKSRELKSWSAFSPDGKSVVFTKENKKGHGMSVCELMLDDKSIRQITRAQGFLDSQPVISPDGNTIAFSRSHLRRRYSMGGWKWDKWDVYTVLRDGTNLKRQTHGNHYDIGGLAFSANSDQIYFSANEFRNADAKETLFTIQLDDSSAASTKPKMAGQYYAWCSDPNTNDKGEMVFISDRNSPFQYDIVFKNHLDKSASLGVTSISHYNKNPVVTNDGRILFLAGTSWNANSRPIFSLWSVNLDGTGAKQLASSYLFTKPSDWNPQP